jgi:Flp pilus assembly pilin Flp
MNLVKQFVLDETGTEAAEWALMVVVLALAILFGGPTIKTALGGALGNVGNGVNRQVANALP